MGAYTPCNIRICTSTSASAIHRVIALWDVSAPSVSSCHTTRYLDRQTCSAALPLTFWVDSCGLTLELFFCWFAIELRYTMGLGVLDDTKLEHVPGTAFVVDDEQRRAETDTILDENLKYDRSGPVPIILVPQPSDDPNDPLNWPLWKRDLMLLILSMLGIIVTTLSPLLAATSVTLALKYKRTFDEVALLTGWHLVGVAVGGFIFVPSSRVWGKRHTFLLGTAIVIFSSAWSGASGLDYTSMLWARVFQGIGLAPFEALVNATVGDLYFVHERGKRMALTNLAVFGGAFFTPILVGKITDSIGWEWSFNFVAIFAGVLLPFLIFFVP